MSALNTEKIIVDNIKENVLYSMQDIHYAMFKNSRKNDTNKKTLKHKDNFEVAHRYQVKPLHARRIFNSIKETTNCLLEKNGLGIYKIDTSNKERVIIKFNQVNCFSSDINEKKLARGYKETTDATRRMPCCISLVYYIRKDAGVSGGHFLYLDHYTSFRFSRMNTSEGDVVIHKGNLKHATSYTHGIGCYDTIKVIIPVYEYVPCTTKLVERVYMKMNGYIEQRSRYRETAKNTASTFSPSLKNMLNPLSPVNASLYSSVM